jgi:hypothetical protein
MARTPSASKLIRYGLWGFPQVILSWGGILGGNPDRSLKSFPPCYSQTPLVLTTFCFLDLRFLQSTAGKGGGGGFWVNKYMDQWRVSKLNFLENSSVIWTLNIRFPCQCYNHWTIDVVYNAMKKNLFKDNTTAITCTFVKVLLCT